tara:strand:- start:443 stop:751 length:309 start_codon:yes stop_codon:yes gene_type:complete
LNKVSFGEVWKIKVDQGFRYALVVSPNSINQQLDQIIVVAISARKKSWPTRIGFKFRDRLRQICLEEISSVNKVQFENKIEELSLPELARVKIGLKQILCEF